MRLLGSLSLFLLWFQSWSQSIGWCRVAPAVWLLVVLKSLIDWLVCCESHEDCARGWVFWDSVVTLMCCAGSRDFQRSFSADQSFTKPAFLKWHLGLEWPRLCRGSARAIQQDKEHLGYPNPEEQPQNFSPQEQQSPCFVLSKILPC